MSSPTPSSQEREAIRQQLEKVAAHPLFSRSERMARFLRLAVERTLDGKADQVKEYLIGVEVFDRGAAYDPRVDPIVRVEARRLRSKLKQYYAGDGTADPIAIEYVSGSYVPQIKPRDTEMLSRLEATGQVFDLTTEGEQFLRDHNVSDAVIAKMKTLNQERRQQLLQKLTE